MPPLCSAQNNHHEENISAKMRGLSGRVSELERAAARRKAKLDENSAFLQFNWKADVVESWIGERRPWGLRAGIRAVPGTRWAPGGHRPRPLVPRQNT